MAETETTFTGKHDDLFLKSFRESGEPYVLLRARDGYSPAVVRYLSMFLGNSANSDTRPDGEAMTDEDRANLRRLSDELRGVASEFVAWQKENADAVKVPD